MREPIAKSSGSRSEAYFRDKLKQRADKFSGMSVELSPEQVAIIVGVTNISDPQRALGEVIEDALMRWARLSVLESLANGPSELVTKKKLGSPKKSVSKRGK